MAPVAAPLEDPILTSPLGLSIVDLAGEGAR